LDTASWLVAFLAASDGGVDPDRLQKGLFLLSEAGVIPSDERYRYEPYLDGPAAPEVWGDLDALVDQGLVTLRAIPGSRWREFGLSIRGRREARAVQERIGPDAAGAVHDARVFVDSMRSYDLAAWMAARFPRFASRTAAGL
jgi:hypothetical protein